MSEEKRTEKRALTAEQIANGKRLNELDQARADKLEEFIAQLEDMVADLWRDKHHIDAQINARTELISLAAPLPEGTQP